jgi:hypothetical protein
MRPYLKNPWEQGREMTQALYAHKNNLKKKSHHRKEWGWCLKKREHLPSKHEDLSSKQQQKIQTNQN